MTRCLSEGNVDAVTRTPLDDHEVVRKGIRTILQERPQWEICGEAKDTREAIELTAELAPDVIIIDVNMPALGGLAAADDIRRTHPKIKILIFTVDQSKALRALAHRCGAHGLVVKSQAARFLIEALDQLLIGSTFFSPLDEIQPSFGVA
jgi:DNA-binding NarL/FixJ family response regulator